MRSCTCPAYSPLSTPDHPENAVRYVFRYALARQSTAPVLLAVRGRNVDGMLSETMCVLIAPVDEKLGVPRVTDVMWSVRSSVHTIRDYNLGIEDLVWRIPYAAPEGPVNSRRLLRVEL